MTKKHLFISLTCIILSTQSLFAQKSAGSQPEPPPPPAAEYNEKSWKTFTSSEGGFSVLMPGQPVKSGELLKSESGGGPLTYYTFNLKTGVAEYGVAYSDFEFVMSDQNIARLAYDGGRDNLLKQHSLKLVEEKDIYIDGFLGRQIIAEGKNFIFHDRMVAVNKRFYQAMIVTRNYKTSPPAISKFYETTVNKFLNSFKLVNTAAVTNSETTAKSTEVASIDLGSVENNVYRNSSFKFQLNLPPEWHVQGRETDEAALKVGRDLVKGSNQQANEAMDKSIAKTLILFTLAKFPLGAPSATQAVLQCGAERITDTRSTSAAYMESNKKFLLASPMRYRLLRDTYVETVGGVGFSVFELEQPRTNGPSVKQKYYSTMRNGFALFFVATYMTAEDRAALEKIMSTLKFE